MRRLYPLSVHEPFQNLSYIDIADASVYASSASCAGKLPDGLRKEIELLVKTVAHPFIERFAGVGPARYASETFIKACVPYAVTYRADSL